MEKNITPSVKIGDRYGKLVVVGPGGFANKQFKKSDGTTKTYKRKLTLCLCDCGNEREVYHSQLISGQYKSCGCIRKPKAVNELGVVSDYKNLKSVRLVAQKYDINPARVSKILTKYNGKKIKWNYQTVKEEALKYEYRNKFKLGSRTAYSYAYQNGILDEICSHMLEIGNSHKRCVYVYEFEDYSAYVGLTMDIVTRDWFHTGNDNSPVKKHSIKTDLIPVKKIITDYLFYVDAQEIERNLIIEYRDNGWNVLNTMEGGQLGGWVGKYKDEDLKNIALQYTSYSEMRKDNYYILRKIRNLGLFDYISHLEKGKQFGT